MCWCHCYYRCFSAEVDLTSLQIDVALRKYQSYFQMPVSDVSCLVSSVAPAYDIEHLQSFLYIA